MTTNKQQGRAEKHRRRHGEGTIVHRSDGRFAGAVSMPNGKRKWLYSRTEAALVRKMNELRKTVQDGQLPPPERITFGQFVALWLDAVKPTVDQSTANWYASYLNNHAVPALGKTRLSKVSAPQLQKLYADRLAHGLAPTSVGHVAAAIHRVLADALKWDYVTRNVAPLATAPRVPKKDMLIFNADQVRTLKDAVKGHRLEALFVTVLFTGAREGELFSLRWQDVDLEAGEINIRRNLQQLPGQWRYVEPKRGPRSKRRILLTPEAVAALKRHQVRQSEERLAVGPEWQDGELVFTNRAGGPLSRQNFLRRDWYPTLVAAGLPRIKFHDMRHTAASLMLAAGVPIPMVSEILGHANAAITLQIYSHAVPGTQSLARDAMATLLSG